MPSGVQDRREDLPDVHQRRMGREQVREDLSRLRSLDRRSDRAGSRRERRRREPRRRRRQSRVRRWPMGDHDCAGTRTRSVPPRRQNSPEPARARRTRMPQHRQAHRRSRVRHHRRRDLLRILRRPRDESRRLRESRSRQCDVAHAERAGRRCRTNYSLELSAADGRVEAGSGDCCWLHLRPQARRADAAHRARIREALRRLRVASGRGQRRHRLRRVLRRSARAASRRQQDCVHRQRRRRQDHREAGRRHGEARDARTRRQVSEHLLRRRRFRSRHRRRALRRLHQSGRSLLCRQPHSRAEIDLQELRRGDDREGEEDQARPAARARNQDGRRWSAKSNTTA